MVAFGAWTLAPFEWSTLDRSTLFAVAFDDTVGNLLVAVPIGWLLADSIGPPRATLLMLVASLGVESTQLFLEGRSAGLSDVLANGLGAGIGAHWWGRPHGSRTADAMWVAVVCWGIAARYGAPGRPVVTVALLLALAMASMREQPADSSDAAGFALVSAGGFLGLSPVPLVLASLGGLAAGVVLAAPLRRWQRALALALPLVLVAETWPPFRTSPRAADPTLMVTEWALLAVATGFLLTPERRSARAGSGSP